MAEYELIHKAVEDLAGIWEYTIEKWSEQQADRYYNLLLDSCRDIAHNPELRKITKK
ncbi:type II toxin-antitoxin system RelE/ParE family toxin [Flagellimonas marinaquae]